MLSSSKKVFRAEPRQILVSAADGTSEIQPAAVGAVFYNATEDYWKERAMSRMGPEPMCTFATPLHLGEQRFGTVARVYIECARDQAVPIELQREMQKQLPCKRVFTLDSDHSPFYSAPKQLAECLEALAKPP